jgi:hypothetical protein
MKEGLVFQFVTSARPRLCPLGYVLRIEIHHDRLTRFVDKLLNGSGCIAAGIDEVPDHDLDLSQLHDEASLG